MGCKQDRRAPAIGQEQLNLHGLNLEILEAWDQGNGPLLSRLYAKAGNLMLNSGRTDEGCFFLTQAYVLALENGLADAPVLHAELARHGREE